MHTALPFVFPTNVPTFVVFRPCSPTDRWQMLAILKGPFASLDEATNALPRHADHARAQVGTIFPLGTFPNPAQDSIEVDLETRAQTVTSTPPASF